MDTTIAAQVGQALTELRRRRPLVHQITNYVTANDCANATLAIGASPIMADDIAEVEAITALSSALVLNIGTLNQRTVAAMLAAGKQANALGIPVVLDPVGAGASNLRNRTTEQLLTEVKFSVVRGNMSEMRHVAGLAASTRGVDASEVDLEGDLEAGRSTAETVARRYGCVAAITRATDVVSDGSRTWLLQNGTPLLGGVTGTGCMCTSLVGAFCGATADPLIAAAGGILALSIAGELAAAGAGSRGSGSLRVALIDELSRLDAAILRGVARSREARD